MPERIMSEIVNTVRLETQMLTAGPADGEPVCFIHGNVSSARFWDETLAALPTRYRGLAPDLRGFGDSEALGVDAMRGLRDFSDDLYALFESPAGVSGDRSAYGAHLVGWSMGGGVALQFAIDHPEHVASVVLVDPLSPYGFGGTKDAAGALCQADAAGSGGGTANPEYVKLLAAKERSGENSFSPRAVMNSFYFKPPFRVAPEREELFVTEMLKMVIGDDNYPGDMAPSEHWPGVGPGKRGVNNAMSPNYCDLSGFAGISPQPPVLWIRGDSDQVVSDTSLFDFGFLGQIGAVPGWPGAEVCPPQPMVAQMRAMLEAYRARGGFYQEEVVADCGHSPHIERPDVFQRLLFTFLSKRG